MRHNVVVARDETGTPAGHRIHFRQRAYFHRNIEGTRQRQYADLLRIDPQSRISEILHDREMIFMSQIDGTLQKPTRSLRTRRIVRIVEHQHFHTIPHLRRHRIQIRQEATFRQRRQQNLLGTAHHRHAMIRGVIRIRICHSIARRNKHGEQRRETINRALHGKKLGFPINLNTIRVAIPLFGSLQKTRFAVERRIPGIGRIVNRLFGHFSNEVSGERIRIAFGQVDHVGPVRNRGSHFAIHIGEHIRRNRLRHRSERNRRNIRSHSSTLPIIVRLYMRTFTHIRNHQCVTLRTNQSPIH